MWKTCILKCDTCFISCSKGDSIQLSIYKWNNFFPSHSHLSSHMVSNSDFGNLHGAKKIKATFHKLNCYLWNPRLEHKCTLFVLNGLWMGWWENERFRFLSIEFHFLAALDFQTTFVMAIPGLFFGLVFNFYKLHIPKSITMEGKVLMDHSFEGKFKNLYTRLACMLVWCAK